MNYRHAFHAGNIADVFKHAVLCRIVAHLLTKPAAFRVIDTHAGAGIYDLAGPEASRSGEWRHGIGKLRAATLDPKLRPLLAPYLEFVAAFNRDGELRVYPGSPALVRAMLRPHDRLVACEVEPQAQAALAQTFRRDRQVRTVNIDGWTALTAFVPPKERRGLVLIDPPFEHAGDFTRLADGLLDAQRKWPTGSYMAWYPVKDRREPDLLAKRLQRSGVAKILRAELMLARLGETERLAGSGLVLINPPWTLADELRTLLPGLAGVLAPARQGAVRLDWLAGEIRGGGRESERDPRHGSFQRK